MTNNTNINSPEVTEACEAMLAAVDANLELRLYACLRMLADAMLDVRARGATDAA